MNRVPTCTKTNTFNESIKCLHWLFLVVLDGFRSFQVVFRSFQAKNTITEVKKYDDRKKIKNTIIEVLHELETVLKKLFIWFTENEMMVYVGKCHLVLSSIENHAIGISGFTVKNSRCEKLLGVHFDDQLKFNFHIETLCKNASGKLHALARVTLYLPMKQILINAFFDSKFNHCSLIWMCHSRNLYHKTNRLHEKCLHIIYNDKSLHMNNYYLKMALFLCIIRICKDLFQKFIKSPTDSVPRL